MSERTYRQIGGAALCAAAMAALYGTACGKSGNTNAASTPPQDTTIQMATGRVAPATPNDAPERTTRRHRASTSAAAATDSATGASPSAATATGATSAPALMTLSAGTAITTTSNARVCSNTYHVGDTFTGNVTGSGGAALPAGAVVLYRVTQVKNSNNMTQSGEIGIAVDSIGVNGVNYPAEADITSAATDKVRATDMGQEATKTGIGAVAGGVLGRVIGHNAKSTIIGAAAGLVAGGATAAATTKYDFCIPQNGKIALKLTSDAKV